MKFSVLMSVYYKENPKHLNEALKSILINQSLIPDELVIVKDGPLTIELEKIVSIYQNKFINIVKIVELNVNSGLGKALEVGLNYCTHEIVARADSDDINHYLRFETQIKKIREFPDIDLVGGQIAEFFESPSDIRFIRKVPTSRQDIINMSRRRNPFNHMTVMFKKSAVLEAGGYRTLMLLEDYYLWIRMMAMGFNLVNIDKVLVYARTGDKMFKRRSDPVILRNWFFLQKEMYNYRLINIIDVLTNMINMSFFLLTPAKTKKYIYKFFLRNGVRSSQEIR